MPRVTNCSPARGQRARLLSLRTGRFALTERKAPVAVDELVSSDRSDVPERLDSWKEIAAYLKRDVTTVRRWEKREGLPVHRHLHARRDSVYAYKNEIDTWWEGRRNHSLGRPRSCTVAGSMLPPCGRKKTVGGAPAKSRNSLTMCAWS